VYHADGRHIGERFTDANAAQKRVVHDGEDVVVWAGIAHREFLCISLMMAT
jgi:hypothetical protein